MSAGSKAVRIFSVPKFRVRPLFGSMFFLDSPVEVPSFSSFCAPSFRRRSHEVEKEEAGCWFFGGAVRCFPRSVMPPRITHHPHKLFFGGERQPPPPLQQPEKCHQASLNLGNDPAGLPAPGARRVAWAFSGFFFWTRRTSKQGFPFPTVCLPACLPVSSSNLIQPAQTAAGAIARTDRLRIHPVVFSAGCFESAGAGLAPPGERAARFDPRSPRSLVGVSLALAL